MNEKLVKYRLHINARKIMLCWKIIRIRQIKGRGIEGEI